MMSHAALMACINLSDAQRRITSAIIGIAQGYSAGDTAFVDMQEAKRALDMLIDQWPTIQEAGL